LIRDYNCRHLEIFNNDYAADGPIQTKFGVPMQHEMPITTGRSKSKPEVEFQYGGRSFFQTGSSYNSLVASDIFASNLKPEVELFHYGGTMLERVLCSTIYL